MHFERHLIRELLGYKQWSIKLKIATDNIIKYHNIAINDAVKKSKAFYSDNKPPMYDIDVEFKENELILTPNRRLYEEYWEDIIYIFYANWLLKKNLIIEDTGQWFSDIVDTDNMKYYELDSYEWSGLTVLKEWKILHCQLLWDVRFNNETEQYESVVN